MGDERRSSVACVDCTLDLLTLLLWLPRFLYRWFAWCLRFQFAGPTSPGIYRIGKDQIALSTPLCQIEVGVDVLRVSRGVKVSWLFR